MKRHRPSTPAAAPAGQQPNILVIFGDDIGQTNISAYSLGLMGYQTPNIDRIAREGMMFTDYYAEQSCTAGRSSFITGQCTLRTGLSKVGMPGATVGLQARDITIAELLKPLGYATGQFGKNHLGDRNEFLPTVHGFDEFFGNLYHLNAEEEPENCDYPQRPGVPEGSVRAACCSCKATDSDDPTEQPRWGTVGKQTIEDTGPLTKKRMETIDDETSAAAIDFIERQVKADKPFFCWLNTTRMHLRTHVRAEHRDKPGLTARTEYADGMIEHDGHVGTILKAVDDLGIANNTIVHLHDRQRPASELVAGRRHDAVPQREEHQLGRRLPRAVHDPLAGPHQARPGLERDRQRARLVADAAGGGRRARTSRTSCSTGYQAGGKTFKVHLDGYNQLPYLTGQQPRARARSSSTSTTTATSSRCATRTGRSCSRSSARKARCESGPSRSPSLRVPKVLRPAIRPVRARRRHLQHLLRLVHGGRSGPIPRGAIRRGSISGHV